MYGGFAVPAARWTAAPPGANPGVFVANVSDILASLPPSPVDSVGSGGGGGGSGHSIAGALRAGEHCSTPQSGISFQGDDLPNGEVGACVGGYDAMVTYVFGCLVVNANATRKQQQRQQHVSCCLMPLTRPYVRPPRHVLAGDVWWLCAVLRGVHESVGLPRVQLLRAQPPDLRHTGSFVYGVGARRCRRPHADLTDITR